MLRNYIKIAYRSLTKRKFYALLNILGLSLGITFSLLIGSYIIGEMQVNSHLQNVDNQYVIQSEWKQESMGLSFTTCGPLAKAMQEEYPDLVKNYYRFDGLNVILSRDDKNFQESVQIGDSTLLEMYGFPLKYGDAATALDAPNSIVISEEIAEKYFGRSDVVNETITIESFSGERRDFFVKAVLYEIPRNIINNFSGLAEVFLPTASLEFFNRNLEDWNAIYMVNFLELKEGVSEKSVNTALAQLVQKYAPVHVKENMKPYVQQVQEYYWNMDNGLVKNRVYTLGLVALFILIMAVVNFVNLMIGHSTNRIREIAVRKVLGGEKRQLIAQFLTESIVLSSFATVISIGFYQLLRPIFGSIIGVEIASLTSFSIAFALIPIGLALIIGILSGLYPAFVLSAFSTTASLKGNLSPTNGNQFFRRILVTTQFSIALFVCCAAVIISQQVSHFFDSDLGYDKSAVISVVLPRDWSPTGIDKMETLRSALGNLSTIEKSSFSYEIPNGNNGFNWSVNRIGTAPSEATTMKVLQTDQMFADVYDIPLLAGSFFHLNEEGHVNPTHIVLSEKAINTLGYQSAEEAIGQQVNLQAMNAPMTISGVTKDFHFESLKKDIAPIVFLHCRATNSYRYMSLKIKEGSTKTGLADVENTFKAMQPNAPFSYTFMDESLDKLYASEIQMKKAGNLSTILAILIVLLGIMGMVALSISKRTKELGIRKVLGAGTQQIVFLFLKEYLIILLIAILIAFPLAYYFMGNWLENYAFHINPEWNIFAATALSFTLTISVLVGFQTLKAAWRNPMKSLRND